jgi:hypothetical protein
MSRHEGNIRFIKEVKDKYSLKTNLRLFAFLVTLFFLGSCNLSIYQVRKGSGDLSKKEFYTVTYFTEIPDGATAKITYINKEGAKLMLKNIAGKWEKSDQYQSGQEMLFKVTLKLPDSKPQRKLSTAITIDGKVFAEQVQTGKNVKFRVVFKLP